MTSEIKSQILLLREQGKSYGEIVDITGVCESTIKTICLRNKKREESGEYCKQCGKRLVFTKGKKKKVFCSDKCRMDYWKEHQQLVKSNPSIEKVCLICNAHFKTHKCRSTKYCSWQCYLESKRGETPMSNNTINYINAMMQAKRMLQLQIMSYDGYLKIESKMAEKYGLNSLSLYRLNDLINKEERVINMIQN